MPSYFVSTNTVVVTQLGLGKELHALTENIQNPSLLPFLIFTTDNAWRLTKIPFIEYFSRRRSLVRNLIGPFSKLDSSNK